LANPRETEELFTVGLRFNPPPGWPPAPAGFTPEPGWKPDPSWPPLPSGWQLWVNDDQPSWANENQPSWSNEDHQPWANDDQPSWANENQPSWANEDHQPWASDDQPSWASDDQPSWDHDDQPSLVSEQQPAAAAPPPPWAAGSPSPAEQGHGSGTSQGADSHQEAVGIYLTGGSYDEDSFYATPIGAAGPGDASGAPADPAPVSTGHPANGNPAQARATPVNLAEPPGFRNDAPSYPTPVSAAGPGDGLSSATPPYPAAVSTSGSGDGYGTLAPPHPGPADGDRYDTGTSSYPAPPARTPMDGRGNAAGTEAGTAAAEGHYGQTWTVGSPYGAAAAPHRSDESPAPGSTTTGWAKASLAAGACFGVGIGAVLGLVALRKIAQTGQRGRAQAALGIVLSAFWTVVLVVGLIWAAAPSPPSRAANGQITSSGSLNVFSLSVGDCFANPPTKQDITSVTAVPCSQPHNAQVYARFKLSGTDANYPGNVTQLGSNGCDAQKDHLNSSLTTDSMRIRFIYPVAHAWKAGERTVTCLIVTPANVSSSLMNP
jgi:putative regulator of septum formation